MAVLMMGGAGGAGSDDCTATRAKVLSGYLAVTKDSDDEVVAGTLTLNGSAGTGDVFPNKTFYNDDPLNKQTGNLAPSSITSFAASNYATGTIQLTWKKPTSGKWSGIRIGYRSDGSFPTNINDSKAIWVETSDTSRTISATVGLTYRFRAWNYLETSVGRIYGSYADASIYAPNNAGSAQLKSSGTWTVPAGVRTVDVFCVGGGGGGSGSSGSPYYGGGGGGGGYTAKRTGISVTPNSKINYVVGDGGAGATGLYQGGNRGSTTWFGGTASSPWISAGGGYGGYYNGTWMNGGAGGSGGGGCSGGYGAGKGGSDGADGGSSYDSGGRVRASGGAGQHSTTRAWGASNGTLYSGGGGGGNHVDSSGASGGDGGGGRGGSGGNGTAGSANTGGGGGGAGGRSNYTGGAGGRGIILISYR